MKYLQNKIKLAALVMAVLSLASCKKDFLDINDNPNDPTDLNITPELLFNQGAVASAQRQASGNFRFLNSWLGYFSAAGDFAIVQDETTYNVDFTFSNNIWGNHYNVLFDLHLAKIKSLAAGDTVMAGACMVLSAKLWQELVDVFGNIPYKQAFQSNQLRTPAYDDDKAIYDDLQLVLDSAKDYLRTTPRINFNTYIGGIVKIGTDPLGGLATTVPGKIAHWIEFANTLKLRMLIHQAEMPGFGTPTAELAKISTGGTLDILRETETVNVQPGFVNETNKQSPYYGNYGYNPNGTDANTSTRGNNYIINVLKANSDARLDRFFTPVSGNVVGTTFGLTAGNPGGSASSKMGPGLIGSATQDAWVFPSFESLFLEAEAIARGWVPGDAEASYVDAVSESFRWLNILPDSTEHQRDSAIEAYYTNNPSANWAASAGATVNSRVRFILYQKYIALTGIDPLETWTDLRRLNYVYLPAGYISANPGKISNVLPVRLLYPQSEYTTNAENVNAQGTINLFTSKIFWQP